MKLAEPLTLRYVPLSTLVRWERNHKRHDLGAIAASISRHGFKDPPKFEPELNGGAGGVAEGNGRSDALTAMRAHGEPVPRGIGYDDSEWYVPVIFGVDAPSQAAAEAYSIDHNNLTMSGGDFTDLDMAKLWDSDGYAALLADLAAQGEAPVSIDETALDALLAALAGPVEAGAGGDEFDATPDDGPTRCALGDLWVIGGVHRLIIGDSTDPATVARLMQGERADLGIHDPPYGIEASGMTMGSGESAKPKSARLSRGQEWDRTRPDVLPLLAASERVCIWGGNYFADVLPVTNDWLCWWKNNDNLSFSEFELAWTNYDNNARHLTHHWGAERKEHITQKPLPVIEWAISQCPGDPALIVDFYLGSGTTLIAAHRTGRRCYGIELSPRYGDVILRRAEAEGLTAERIETL